MELSKLIDVADRAYGSDSTVLRAFAAQQAGGPGGASLVGDGLAWFIAGELTETFGSEETDAAQLTQAVASIERAKEQLDAVQCALQDAADAVLYPDSEDPDCGDCFADLDDDADEEST